MAGLLYDPTKPMPLIEMVNHPAWMGVKPTLGQRNNNYGNLRTTDAFEGKTGVNKSYDTYETPEKGMRALARVLDTYSSKHGINTIDQLINRYAPASDNTGGSHENYKKFLAQKLGVSPNDPIDVKGRRAEIMDAIIRFENKNRPLASPQMINQAITDADGSKEPTMAKKIVRLPNGTAYEYDDETGTGALIEQGPMSQFQGYHQDGQNAALAQPIGSAAAQPSEIEKAMADSLRAEGVPEHEIGAYIEGQRARQADGTVYNDMGTVMPSPVPPQMNGDGSDAAAEGAELERSGILINPANAGTLTGNEQPLTQGVLSQLPAQPKMSANRRDQSPMSLQASPAVDFNDMLIRMGGRGVEASQRGGLAAFGAVTDEYGKIQDANSAASLKAYQAALKADQKNAKQLRADQEQIGQIDQTMSDMTRAKAALRNGGVTGLWDATVGAGWDKLVGNDREQNARMLLQKLRVDDTLLRIAQTKGAISNKEMDLFLSPSPELTDQEGVWVRWIEDREQALMRVRSRLSGGQTVDPSEQASSSQVDQFGSQVSTGAFNVGQSQTINGVTVKRTK